MALCLADAAPLSSSSINARLAGGAVVAATATLTATMYTFHITLHTFQIGRLGAALTVETTSLGSVGVEQAERDDDDEEETGDHHGDYRCHGNRFFDGQSDVERIRAFVVLHGQIVVTGVVHFDALDT